MKRYNQTNFNNKRECRDPLDHPEINFNLIRAGFEPAPLDNVKAGKALSVNKRASTVGPDQLFFF